MDIPTIDVYAICAGVVGGVALLLREMCMQAEQVQQAARDAREQREAAAVPVPMTVVQALDHATWVRRTPDGFMSPEKARETIVTLLSALESSRCFLNAVSRGHRTFVLVEQDFAAPMAIHHWAEIAEAHGCPPEKVAEAYRIAIAWGVGTFTHNGTPKKWPD